MKKSIVLAFLLVLSLPFEVSARPAPTVRRARVTQVRRTRTQRRRPQTVFFQWGDRIDPKALKQFCPNRYDPYSNPPLEIKFERRCEET